MTCTICHREIAKHAPVILLNVALVGHRKERFTGGAWHPECAPVGRKQRVEEARALLAPPRGESVGGAMKSKGGVFTCLDCGHRGWRLTIRSRCPMCGAKATVSNTV